MSQKLGGLMAFSTCLLVGLLLLFGGSRGAQAEGQLVESSPFPVAVDVDGQRIGEVSTVTGNVITVTGDLVEVSGDDQCSLIEAIENAQGDTQIHADCPAGSSDDIIELTENVTYTLTSINITNTLGANGLPSITGTVVINGNGATIARSSAEGTPDFRIFHVSRGGDLTLRNLTLTNGAAGSNHFGGAIESFGALTLEQTQIVSNTAGMGGGGLLLGDGPVVIVDSVVSGNSAGSAGGGLQVQEGTVELANVTIANNRAPDGGALVTVVGDKTLNLTINGSTIEQNIAEGSADPLDGTGGGIRLSRSITGTGGATLVEINDTLIRNNQALNGGGIGMGSLQPNSADLIQLTLNRSAVVNNQAQGTGTQQGNGGGIINLNAVLHLMDSTISSNTATGNPQVQFSGVGGGIANGRTGLPTTIYMTNTSVISNTALAGGGVLNALAAGTTGPVVNFANSLIAGNTALGGAVFGPSCLNQGGTLTSLGHNLDQNNNCGFTSEGDQTGVDPLLDALADNGGPTPTHALLAGSLAIDTGSNALCTFTDQRNVARPQGLRCDIGAYEAPFTEPGPYNVPDGDVRALSGAIRAASETGTSGPERGITAPAVVNLAANGNYTLTSINITNTLGANGLPLITGTVVINGNGATIARSSAEGTPDFRIFHVSRGGDLTLRNLTLTNGAAGSNHFGGAIESFGALTLEQTQIVSNTAGMGGGGLLLGDGPVVIVDSVVSGNSAGSAGGGLQVQEGTVELTNVTIANNRAPDGGGLVTVVGDKTLNLTINSSTIEQNIAEGSADPLDGTGGGIRLSRSITGTGGATLVEINDTLIRNNQALNGGGIGMGSLQPNSADLIQLTLNRSAVVNNQAQGTGTQQGNGGGILNLNAVLHLMDSTISSNTATGNPQVQFSGVGGGIANGRTGLPTTIYMTNTSVISNTALAGGGILNALAAGTTGPVVNFANSLIAGNTALGGAAFGPSCLNQGGTLTSLGHNLDQNNNCAFTTAGDQTGVDPLLDALADNGGPTPTHALLAGSPAIDTGSNALCTFTDQRGVARPQSLGCDIGAFEATELRVYLPFTRK